MIDSHVHLNHPDFREDLDDVLERAQHAGVTRMVNIGFDLESSRETVELADRFPFLLGAIGVHPHDAVTYDDKAENELEQLLANERIIAVGEIGLDFYRDHSPRRKQQEVFEKQISLAARVGKPIIIHCRDAFDDVMAILLNQGERYRGIFHAFTGDESMANRVLGLGLHIGIGGVVTFKKSNLADVVSKLPSDVLVLETDCPYLTPAPFRGKRNEPAYIVHVLEKVSEATGRSVEQLTQETDRNFANAMNIENKL